MGKDVLGKKTDKFMNQRDRDMEHSILPFYTRHLQAKSPAYCGTTDLFQNIF
jgi:hypothetical protein